jgi:hypothetical protein
MHALFAARSASWQQQGYPQEGRFVRVIPVLPTAAPVSIGLSALVISVRDCHLDAAAVKARSQETVLRLGRYSIV